MFVLAIETSCDDTCAAVMENDRVLASVISSQTDLHKEWGGVVPDIAKRAHQSRILPVIATALKRSKIQNPPPPPLRKDGGEKKFWDIIDWYIKKVDVIAVTQGPGLAIALSIGVNTAKGLAIKYDKPLVAVNHVEGHLLSNLVKNRKGKPDRKIEFPALALTVSGGHTKIFLVKKIGEYEVVGETLDDAAGEALDKAAKLLGLGYPGGPVIERLAKGHDKHIIPLPKPLADKKVLDYSFSGLKTSFYYQIKDWAKDKVNGSLKDLAATFQEAVFETLLRKFRLAIERYQPKMLLAAGGVLANMELRQQLRKLAKESELPILMPVKKELNTDNAMMIGIVGYYKALQGEFADPKTLDRNPRLEF